MNRPIILIGGGAHARVLADALHAANRKILGYTERAENLNHAKIDGLDFLGEDTILDRHEPGTVDLVLGFGKVDVSPRRLSILRDLTDRGHALPAVIHPSAVIGSNVKLGAGTQVMAGAIIQSGSILGDACIVNTCASVDHDCQIGHDVHLAPGVTLCGDVQVRDSSFIGAGSTIVNRIIVGSSVFAAAGSVIARNLNDSARVRGVPAKPFTS